MQHFKLKHKNSRHFTISSLQDPLSIYLYKYLWHSFKNKAKGGILRAMKNDRSFQNIRNQSSIKKIPHVMGT